MSPQNGSVRGTGHNDFIDENRAPNHGSNGNHDRHRNGHHEEVVASNVDDSSALDASGARFPGFRYYRLPNGHIVEAESSNPNSASLNRSSEDTIPKLNFNEKGHQKKSSQYIASLENGSSRTTIGEIGRNESNTTVDSHFELSLVTREVPRNRWLVIFLGMQKLYSNAPRKIIADDRAFNVIGAGFREFIETQHFFTAPSRTKAVRMDEEDGDMLTLLLKRLHSYDVSKELREISFQNLILLTDIVAKFNCQCLFRSYAPYWVSKYEDQMYHAGYEQMLFVTYTFGFDEELRRLVTWLSMKCEVNEHGTLLLPATSTQFPASIPEFIIESIRERRLGIIQRILNRVYHVRDTLTNEDTCCKHRPRPFTYPGPRPGQKRSDLMYDQVQKPRRTGRRHESENQSNYRPPSPAFRDGLLALHASIPTLPAHLKSTSSTDQNRRPKEISEENLVRCSRRNLHSLIKCLQDNSLSPTRRATEITSSAWDFTTELCKLEPVMINDDHEDCSVQRVIYRVAWGVTRGWAPETGIFAWQPGNERMEFGERDEEPLNEYVLSRVKKNAKATNQHPVRSNTDKKDPLRSNTHEDPLGSNTDKKNGDNKEGEKGETMNREQDVAESLEEREPSHEDRDSGVAHHHQQSRKGKEKACKSGKNGSIVTVGINGGHTNGVDVSNANGEERNVKSGRLKTLKSFFFGKRAFKKR